MSLQIRAGPDDKDLIIFATKEDHSTPSTVTLPEPEVSPGLILPNGDINWNCPCLGGMATGPCGVQFRESFSCFHYSEADPKGSDCYEVFSTMQDCMAKYPTVYNKENDDDNSSDQMNFEDMEEAGKSTSPDQMIKENSDSKELSEKNS